jgi:hypothetical protein
MSDTAASTSAPVAPARGKGLVARVVGVFVSPRATYADVAARPRWLGAFLVGSVVAIVGLFVLFSTEVGQQAWLDQQVKGAESFGRTISDQQYEGMERIAPYIRYIVAGGYLVFIPIVLAAVSGILLGVFNALLGGDASFKQVLAVMSHAGLITAFQTVFAVPLDYMRETLSSPTTLAVFLPFIEENTFLGRFGARSHWPSGSGCSTSGARRPSPGPCFSCTSSSWRPSPPSGRLFRSNREYRCPGRTF